MMKMPMRSRLLRVTFIATAAGLVLNAIIFDNATLPFAMAVTLATLIYEFAYHMAMRMEAETKRGSAPVTT